MDDPWFESLNLAQWWWYNSVIAQEEMEEHELKRDMYEYLAWFSEPERVKDIKNKRTLKEKSGKESDEAFDKLMKDKYGLDLGSQRRVVEDSKEEIVRNEKINPDDYLDFDLDEVHFIPEDDK